MRSKTASLSADVEQDAVWRRQLEAKIQELQQERDAAKTEVGNLQAALRASGQLSEQLDLAQTSLADMQRNLTDQVMSNP